MPRPHDRVKQAIVREFKKGEGKHLTTREFTDELNRRNTPLRFHRTTIIRWINSYPQV